MQLANYACAALGCISCVPRYRSKISLQDDRMLWLEHLFAVCLLGHMLWAAILLQREWRRLRLHGLAGQQAYRKVPHWREAKVTQAT
jgi:hypothetical protein